SSARRRRLQFRGRRRHRAPPFLSAVPVDRGRARGDALHREGRGRRPLMRRYILPAVALGALVACKPPANAPPPRSTLVVGLDISGSFRNTPHFKEALEFAGLYIYAHLN